jgi:hypothetical protein
MGDAGISLGAGGYGYKRPKTDTVMVMYLESIGAESNSNDLIKYLREKRASDSKTNSLSSPQTSVSMTVEEAYAVRNANETPAQKRERAMQANQWDVEERARLRREPNTIMRTNPYRMGGGLEGY